MAPRGEARLVEDLRDFLDDFAFRAKRLAAPLLRPFGPAAEPAAVDDAELDKLKTKLRRIRATLRAAEDRAVADDSVALWLRELRDLEHAAEDVLEELEFEALRAARLEGFKAQLLRSCAGSGVGGGKRKREISLMYSSSPDRLSRKIARIMERYNEIARDRDALRLRSGDGERRREVSPMTPTSCLTKCRLHGRERDMSRVTQMLLSNEANCCDVYSVVPIVGPGAVGKTSLAQHIYNEEAISSKFDIKMWVWVCQEFDVLKLSRKLAEEAMESPCDFADMNQMHRVITDRLKGKRFLLVLDDVWDESRDRWASLQVPLKCAARGSKIVVTTRSTKVAKMMALKMHQLGYLSDTNCWSVCQDAALRGRDPSIINDCLISIGKSVAARCKGLPLAANALGHVLSSAIDRNHWEAVEQSDLWNSEVVEQTLPALLVSYNSLQKHLKRCFSYCSLFPKGYLFRKDKLVRLWLAQGFVEADREHHAEDIACRYFDDLVDKFFLQKLPYNEERYVMHDLYHELAEYVSAKEYSRIEEYTFGNLVENARHISLAPNEDHSNEIIQFYKLQTEYMKESQFPGLRTLLVVQKDELKDDGNTLYIKFPNCMFKLLGSLRALDLSNTNMELLPHSVGELIHLRYLSLENTKIKCLPESISALFKLHSMNLKCCNNLSELPKGIRFLTNLRHLELPSMDDWKMCMPCGIGELINLQTIHVIKVGSDSDSCGIADLVNLNKLRGELCISGIENVTSTQITPEASIKNKGELRKLILHWSCIDSMFSDEATSVLDSLQPHPDLEELTIRGFSGVRFPLWLGNQYMLSLSILELKDCQNCKELPSLGRLPCLKHLSIKSLTSIKHVRRMISGHDKTNCSDYKSCTSRAFPTLETLKFADMDSWELWDEVEATDFPCLQHLTIMRCSKLSGLPNLQALQNLRIKTCENLLELPSFPSLQCIKIEGFWSVSQVLQLPIFSHIETLELSCHKKLVSVKKIQNPLLYSLRLKQKGLLHKVSRCQMLPFQNRFVQDSQRTWTFLRCAGRILECSCNFIAFTDLTFGQTNVHPSEVVTCEDVSFHTGQPEDGGLVSCKPGWVQMGQPEEVELVYID
ncbi:unnamed protein product [Urochloa decumbens]|uniref:Uncharacterized protein n=1 Tax=Urochloa decumbens TaxID=240449 RepID=A0ABC9CVN0_9POAL